MESRTELKYPIKYAVMPVYEQIDNESKVANIVSKCYVIGERKEYLSDGTFRVKFEVVFPFIKKNNSGWEFVQVIPQYDFYSQCTNSMFVGQLFNDFTSAQVVAVEENENILRRMIETLPYDVENQGNLKTIKEKHQETLNRYKKVEAIIEQKTCDLIVSKSNDSILESLIEKVIDNPLDFYIKLARAMTIEDREKLKQLIGNRSCSNCTNGSCKLESFEKTGVDEFGNLQGSYCLSWNNPKLIGKQLILRKE